MTPPEPANRWRHLWDLFHDAREMDVEERSRFLARVADENPDLGRELAELLAADEAPAARLDRSPQPRHAGEAGATAETPFAMPLLQPGQELADRFEIVRVAGSGGMGTVYEARDRELATAVALKTLRSELAANPDARHRFRREIELSRRVTHPNVCRVFDLFRHRFPQGGEVAFVTMELLQGETLEALLRRRGALPVDEAQPIVEQIAAALSAAHRVGIVHRDLKPANVVLVPEADEFRVVVTDFGIACLSGAGTGAMSRLTRAGQVVGTPDYMAPEQLEDGEVSSATDVYALGLMTYEIVTGRLPFHGASPISAAVKRLRHPPESPRKLRPELPPSWESAILRSLFREPGRRWGSAREFAAALSGETETVIELPIEGQAAAADPPEGRPRYRRLWVALGLGAAAALAAALLLPGILRDPPVGMPVEDQSVAPGVMAPEKRQWVVIADFDNRTGEAVFDDTIEQALERELASSQVVSVAPQERIGDALQLMRRPDDTPLVPSVAREVALRDGGIPRIIEGSVDRLGGSYLLSAKVLATESGETLASLAEEASDQGAVLPAIRRLASGVRRALGEEAGRVRRSEASLSQVTTPSLGALHLYTQADTLMRSHRFGAGATTAVPELLREAIDEDPGFASAHMLLAFYLRNTGHSREEYLPPAQRAFELSRETPEHEKYFIRGGYYSMLGNDEEAAANYWALFRLHPDHPWGGNNLVNTLVHGLHRYEEAVPLTLRLAEIRPHHFPSQFGAAYALAVYGDRPLEANELVARAQELAPPTDDFATSWLELYPAMASFLRRDPAAAIAVAEEVRQAAVAREDDEEDLLNVLAGVYLAAGRLHEAELLGRRVRWSIVPFEAALVRGDGAALANLVARSFEEAPTHTRREPERAVLLARAGEVAAAREALRGLEVRNADPAAAGRHRWYATHPSHVLEIVRGEILLAEDRGDEGIAVLRRALAVERPVGSAIYFLGSEALADALVAEGDVEGALRVLESATGQLGWQHPANGAHWLRVRGRLAELYRAEGRQDEATEIDNDLRRLLAEADPDHAFVRRLDMAAKPPPS